MGDRRQCGRFYTLSAYQGVGKGALLHHPSTPRGTPYHVWHSVLASPAPSTVFSLKIYGFNIFHMPGASEQRTLTELQEPILTYSRSVTECVQIERQRQGEAHSTDTKTLVAVLFKSTFHVRKQTRVIPLSLQYKFAYLFCPFLQVFSFIAVLYEPLFFCTFAPCSYV